MNINEFFSQACTFARELYFKKADEDAFAHMFLMLQLTEILLMGWPGAENQTNNKELLKNTESKTVNGVMRGWRVIARGGSSSEGSLTQYLKDRPLYYSKPCLRYHIMSVVHSPLCNIFWLQMLNGPDWTALLLNRSHTHVLFNSQGPTQLKIVSSFLQFP